MPTLVAGRPHPDVESRALSKVLWRLVPFLGLLYVLNILDRGNAGFARLTMQDDLGLSRSDFDIAVSLFYVGYLLFEVPSNLLLRRFGARRWIARIMITWGVVSCATMAVQGVTSFALVRVLLGVAEAGFFPGIVLYLTFWVPARHRARILATFICANAIASVVGNPVSGAILYFLDGAAGVQGWRWLFLLEGLPSVLVGLAVFAYLPDGPADARWLEADERAWLLETLQREETARRGLHPGDLTSALLDGRVWLLIGVYFTVAVGSNASAAYLPTLIKERFTDLNPLQIGFLGAIPHVCAAAVMTAWGALSDRRGDSRVHVAGAALIAAAGWGLSAATPDPWLAFAGFCVAQAGMMAMLPTFWVLPTGFLSGAGAAGGIALINSVANLGGLLGPSILGRLGLWALAGLLVGGAGLVLLLRNHKTESPEG